MSGAKALAPAAPWYQVFGLGPKPDPTIYGQRLTQYPTSADVANARASGLGYGTGNEAYIAGQTSNQWSIPRSGKRLTRAISIDDTADTNAAAVDPKLRNPMPGTPALADIYGAAQLAALRSPITALGYDPHKIALDTQTGGEVTVAGMYAEKPDSIYSNAAMTSNLIHESTHRGLAMLRQAGLIPEELQKRLPKKEEDIVRYIMALHMGDPEKGRGPEGDEQRASGLWEFGHDVKNPQDYKDRGEPSTTAEHRKALNELNAIASRYIAARTPGGPR